MKSIGQNEFMDGKLAVYDHRLNHDIYQDILSVASEPVKSTCSDGRWLVMFELAIPLGNGRTHSDIPVWRKAEAIETIKYLQSYGLPEYKWR